MVEVAGRLYLFGGKSIEGLGASQREVFRDDLWKFDSSIPKWTQISQPETRPSKRAQHMLIALPHTGVAGSILLIGGEGKDFLDRGCSGICKKLRYFTDIWSYDIASNFWTKTGDGPEALNWGISCPYNDCTESGPSIHNNKFVSISHHDNRILSFGGWKVKVYEQMDETWVLERSNVTTVAQNGAGDYFKSTLLLLNCFADIGTT